MGFPPVILREPVALPLLLLGGSVLGTNPLLELGGKFVELNPCVPGTMLDPDPESSFWENMHWFKNKLV
jgi:hypothetical protein